MESRVIVKTTLNKMNELICDKETESFIVKYADTIEEGAKINTYDVIVRHNDTIGKQDGKTFTAKTFRDTFDEIVIRSSVNENKPLIEDVEMVRKGINGGLPAKTVAKVLQIYGSERCKNDKYIKSIMKSEEIQSLIKHMKQKEVLMR